MEATLSTASVKFFQNILNRFSNNGWWPQSGHQIMDGKHCSCISKFPAIKKTPAKIGLETPYYAHLQST